MAPDTPDARAARLARRQAAHLARSQAHAVGVSDPSIKRRVRAGRWQRVHPGVYRLAGAPEARHGPVWARPARRRSRRRRHARDRPRPPRQPPRPAAAADQVTARPDLTPFGGWRAWRAAGSPR